MQEGESRQVGAELRHQPGVSSDQEGIERETEERQRWEASELRLKYCPVTVFSEVALGNVPSTLFPAVHSSPFAQVLFLFRFNIFSLLDTFFMIYYCLQQYL